MKLNLEKLIEKFIKDLDCKHIPSEIDLVLEGGAFNGSYEIGILLYIKELEKRNKLKVNRISGTSVGAILGVAYILDKINLFNIISNRLIENFIV